jgi:adenosylcobinamide-phosphate synthase
MDFKMVLIDIAAAYIIDLAAGDPHWLPHPVRAIGWMISKLEGVLGFLVDKAGSKYAMDKGKAQRIAGGFMALAVVSVAFFTVFLLLVAAKAVHPVMFHVLNIYFIYTAFAARCLADEGMKVYRSLVENDLSEAQRRVAMLVGRETDRLDEKGVTRAVVETLAENTVDGVISPIIFTVLGAAFGIAAPVVYAFKAVSTLDSMVGYMNEKYIDFGRISAKLDDVLNYIPARISGLIIPVAAFLCGREWKESFRIMFRDRRKHNSPNCAYPEAAVAGALGIRLGGSNTYFGKNAEKPTIGDERMQLEAGHIKETIRIMYFSSAVTLLIGIGVMIVLCNI